MRCPVRNNPLLVTQLLLLTSVAVLAQETATTSSQGPSDLKEINVIIVDNKNHSLKDVRQDDVQIIENKVPQTIEYFSYQNRPVRYGIVVDNSGSLRTQFPMVIEAAKRIINGNREHDESFIMRFVSSDSISLVQKRTANKSELLAALAKLKPSGGQTALIDAIYVGIEQLLRYAEEDKEKAHRNVIVLITDGENRISYYRVEQLFELLHKANIQFFIIGFIRELDNEGGLIRKAPRVRAVEFIERIAKESAGRAFLVNKAEDVSDIVAELNQDLHEQYVIRYRSAVDPNRKNYKIEIKVSDAQGKKKRRAIMRQSYILDFLTPLNVKR